MRAVRSLRSLHETADASGVAGAPVEILVSGAGGDIGSETNGFYLRDGSHRDKPLYQKIDNEDGKIYFSDRWKIGRSGIGGWTYEHPDVGASQPPVEGWAPAFSDASPPPTLWALPHVLQVEGGSETGFFVRADNVNGKPRYRKAGGSAIIEFQDVWKMRPGEGLPEIAVHSDTSGAPPAGQWTADTAPSVSWVDPSALTAPKFYHVRGAGGRGTCANGWYIATGTANGRPKLYQVGGDGIIYSSDGPFKWRINYRDNEGGWYYSHGEDSSTPPEGAWTREGYLSSDADPPPHVTSHDLIAPQDVAELSTASSAVDEPAAARPFLVVRGAGRSSCNGRYAYVGVHGGRPKYRKLGAAAIIFYESGLWRLNNEENTGQRVYDGLGDAEEMPPSEWRLVNPLAAPSPTVSEGTWKDLQPGDQVIFSTDDSDADWTECPMLHMSFYPGYDPEPIVSIQGDWFTAEVNEDLAAPLDALATVRFDGRPHVIRSATRGGSPPFLVVRGAGRSSCNGRYAYVGVHGGRPKYRKLGAEAIIFYESGLWRLNVEENTRQRKYDGLGDAAEMPPSEWRPVSESYGPPPTLCEGTWKDLQPGDQVIFGIRDRDADWTGCPMRHMSFSPGYDPEPIVSIQGDWFTAAVNDRLAAPLDALGTVRFDGRPHVIRSATRGPAASPASGSGEASASGAGGQESQSPELGYEEEWCEGQDVQRFMCPICMCVARDAMSHHCGSALFCELCWLKCQADDSNCPVCREDGATVAPAHFERRTIKNLLMRCRCGETFPLYDKEKHTKDLCPKREVSCSACGGKYAADEEEQHQTECSARSTTCPLCGERVPANELEAHYGSNPGKHIMKIAAMLEELDSLRQEVRQLRGET